MYINMSTSLYTTYGSEATLPVAHGRLALPDPLHQHVNRLQYMYERTAREGLVHYVLRTRGYRPESEACGPAPGILCWYGCGYGVGVRGAQRRAKAIFGSFPGQFLGLGTRITPRVCTCT